MNVLIVHAHPEPKSFNGAMKDAAVAVLQERGRAVRVSDLHAMNWKPVADALDFAERSDPAFLKIQAEQGDSQRKGTIAPDIAAEQEKLRWADLVILQFPLWWFSIPAILKGWVDRVFSMGFAYGGGKWYDKGGLAGKKAMLSLTTGGPAGFYTARGINGEINDLLHHIQHGMLFFVGFQVLPPFIAYGAARSAEKREEYLRAYRDLLARVESVEPLPFHPLSDFDENFQLKPGIARGIG